MKSPILVNNYNAKLFGVGGGGGGGIIVLLTAVKAHCIPPPPSLVLRPPGKNLCINKEQNIACQ